MTTLSKLQYAMIDTFHDGRYLSVSQAQQYDQRPFRSMLVRGWVAYRPGRGFHITSEGRKAYDDFHHGNIGRKNPLGPLTRYFDPLAYGLKVGPEKVHVMKKTA